MATKDFSSVQESKVADALGWKVVTGSGARPCVPGDVRSDKWLGECKTHTEPGQRIFFDLAVWEKIQHEADVQHRSPALIVDDGSQDLNKTWVLCRAVSISYEDMAQVDPNFAIRKNISFDHTKVADYMKSLYKTSGGSIVFNHMCMEIRWGGQIVCVLPFTEFMKVNDR